MDTSVELTSKLSNGHLIPVIIRHFPPKSASYHVKLHSNRMIMVTIPTYPANGYPYKENYNGAISYSWKLSRDLYFKNFVVQTKFVKYKTFESIILTLSIAKIRENCILELANESKFVKYRDLENNQLYGM